MALGWKDWTKNDILYGIIVPLIVILIIVGFSQLGSLLSYESFGIIIGITSE